MQKQKIIYYIPYMQYYWLNIYEVKYNLHRYRFFTTAGSRTQFQNWSFSTDIGNFYTFISLIFWNRGRAYICIEFLIFRFVNFFIHLFVVIWFLGTPAMWYSSGTKICRFCKKNIVHAKLVIWPTSIYECFYYFRYYFITYCWIQNLHCL